MISGPRFSVFLLLLSGLLLSPTLQAADDSMATPDPVALIEALDVPEGQVEFREEKHDPLLSSKLVSRGYLSRDGDGALTKQTVFPRQETIIIGLEQIELQRDGDTRVFDPRRRPAMASLFTSLRALIGGDAATLQQHFNSAAETTANGWTINLVPKDENLLDRLEKLEVHGTDRQIRVIHTHMQDGSWQRLQLVSAEDAEPADS